MDWSSKVGNFRPLVWYPVEKEDQSVDLKEFLYLEHPEQYDFKREIIHFSPEADEIERFMVYQAVGIQEDGAEDPEDYRAAEELACRYPVREEKGEADRCALTKVVFQRLWDEEILKICPIGDTMNSVNTTLNHRLNLKSKRKMIRTYLEEPQRMEGIATAARKFLQFSYSVGNFIPVPRHFNIPRYGKTRDYWDLTLNGIWSWYTRGECLHSIIGAAAPYCDQSKNIKICERWLERFGSGEDGWSGFVEKNYMQDFVNGGQEGRRYGGPKELWQGHFDGKILPNTEDALQFFSNAAGWIEARGVRIVLALKESFHRQAL